MRAAIAPRWSSRRWTGRGSRCGASRRPCWRAASTVVDRKSTRLNSSHLGISYAVFRLKKKKGHITNRQCEFGTVDVCAIPSLDTILASLCDNLGLSHDQSELLSTVLHQLPYHHAPHVM